MAQVTDHELAELARDVLRKPVSAFDTRWAEIALFSKVSEDLEWQRDQARKANQVQP